MHLLFIWRFDHVNNATWHLLMQGYLQICSKSLKLCALDPKGLKMKPSSKYLKQILNNASIKPRSPLYTSILTKDDEYNDAYER